MIFDKAWTDKEIFFLEETQIDLSNYVNDSIRFIKKNEEKLKRGDLDAYDLITRQKKNFEKYIMVTGGLSFHEVGKLMILHGIENEFCYAHTIMNYQRDIGKKSIFGKKTLQNIENL